MYTFEIDLDTLVTEANEYEEEDYFEEWTGFATLEKSTDGEKIYAESLKSADNARLLVLNYLYKFQRAYFKVVTEIK